MKPFAELSEVSINANKRKKCVKCTWAVGNSTMSMSTMTCNYYVWTGHRRGCDPRVCDKFEPRKRGQKRKAVLTL